MEKTPVKETWSSPIPEQRWRGFRDVHRGPEAFKSLENFEQAQVSELVNSLEDHERQALGRLLSRGKKVEIEVFLRTHGANPIVDPQAQINIPIGVPKADVVDLSNPSSEQANKAILNGDVVHVLFQAGEASRFNRGPLFKLNPLEVARELSDELNLKDLLKKIDELKTNISPSVADFLAEGPFGPKQALMIRAGLRRVINEEIKSGRLSEKAAVEKYKEALWNQKVLFFIGRQGGVNEAHDQALREKFKFYGFNPQNLATLEQELVHGIKANENGEISLASEDYAMDAAGHLYAFLQAARPGDFTTYTESGRPIKPMETDALAYLSSKGGRYLSIIRINDMDRHSTEILNGKAIGYALRMFEKGYFNVIEGVANPGGQKGGTATCFDDAEIHVLTETHENSFPSLSKAMEEARKKYLEDNNGKHPAYNAMRQFADLQQTRTVLREFGGRIVFVPRQKKVDGKEVSYVGVDMPMGDLSLFLDHYKSRMFQFQDFKGNQLLIHDMKKKENLKVAVDAILTQLQDPHVLAAAKELLENEKVPFVASTPPPRLYGAPAPEFE